MGFFDLLEKGANILSDTMSKKEKEYELMLRTKSDSQILRGVSNAQNSIARNMCIQEAKRRGLM